MPWTVKNDPEGCSASKPWSVVKLTDGEIVGCHATEDMAQAQVAALYAGEDEEEYNDRSEEMTEIATEESQVEEIDAEETPGEGEVEVEEISEETEEVPEEEIPAGEAAEEEISEEEPTPEAEEPEPEAAAGNRAWAEARLRPVPAASCQVAGAVRTDYRKMPPELQERLAAEHLDVGVVDRVGRGLFELRFRPEFRFNDDGSVFLHGYATVYDHPYEVMGGPPFGWVETIAARACAVSVNQGADVRLLINHDGIPLARTRSNTLRLESDDIGLYSCAPNLDMRSPTVQSLVSAMQRGDMDEMSFAFRAIQQIWNEDYTERQITEVKLYDVSVVTYPANPATVTSVRSDPPAGSTIPAGLARAQADRLRLRTRS